ncbi:MAG: SEL1-like repeat protein [Firmicutes bacterium]|nr:SEL1-like repeat protein [Bacillota bacterium]
MKALSDAINLFGKQRYEEAYSIFLPLAKNGDPTAEYYVGLYFRKGFFVIENRKEAFKWFLRSAESGLLESQYIVGASYSETPGMAGTPLSKDELNRIQTKMDDNPHYIPFFHCDGVGVEPDNDKSFEWMMKAAKQGHTNAINQLPSYLIINEISRENRFTLYKWIEEETQKDNSEVFYINGEILQGVWEKSKEALDSYKKAYELGCTKAIDRIGELYENKDGDVHDYSEALKWYLLGANEHNLVFSQYRLGHLYRTGRGVKKDFDIAIEWFKTAADNAYYDPWIFSCIGKLYQQKGDDNEAIKWFIKGAELFDNESEMRLKDYYDRGFDVGATYKDKYRLFEEAKSGDEGAQIEYSKRYAREAGNNLGFFNWIKYDSICDYPDLQEKYINNYISNLNIDDDLKCWELLANSGNSYAQYIMAIRHNDESTIDYNVEKALYWYELASKHHIDAQIDMGYFYAHGILVEIDYLESYKMYQDVARKMLNIDECGLLRRYSHRKLKFNAGNDLAEEKALNKEISAMLYMGCLYQHGFEIQQDQKKAIYWYEMAVSHGSDEAREQLYFLEKGFE